MNVLLVTIPLSLLLLICAAAAFFWAVDHDQFDDLETPGLLPLDDDAKSEGAPTRDEPNQ
jgi:cbb3-type cytochrome oxidase maturation protein